MSFLPRAPASWAYADPFLASAAAVGAALAFACVFAGCRSAWGKAGSATAAQSHVAQPITTVQRKRESIRRNSLTTSMRAWFSPLPHKHIPAFSGPQTEARLIFASKQRGSPLLGASG